MRTLNRYLVLFCVLCFVAGSSCRNADPEKEILGLWMGVVSNKITSQSYTLVIMPEGKLIFEGFTMGQEQFGTGKWELKNGHFTATLVTHYGFEENLGTIQQMSGKFDASSGKLSDLWAVVTQPRLDSARVLVDKVR